MTYKLCYCHVPNFRGLKPAIQFTKKSVFFVVLLLRFFNEWLDVLLGIE